MGRRDASPVVSVAKFGAIKCKRVQKSATSWVPGRKECLAGIFLQLGRRWRQRLGLLLDGIDDNRHYEAEAAKGFVGLAHATVVAGGGVAESGFHLLEVGDAALGYPGEVGDVTVALIKQVNETSLPGGIKDFFIGEVVSGRGLDDAVNDEGEAGV